LRLHVILVMILSLIGLLYLGKLSYSETIEFNKKTETIVKKSTIYENIKLNLDTFIKDISFKLLGGGKEAELKKINAEREKNLYNSKKYALYYFLLILVTSVILYTQKDLFSLFISIVALISLTIAIFTPILVLIVKTNEMAGIGSVVLQYDVKTIIGVIKKLFNSGNYLLFIVLLLFSIIIPFAKSIIILLSTIFKGSELHNIIKAIGKWSMVDVFVVAIMVVLYTVNSDINSKVIVESGLYFFLIYVIVSMVSSYEIWNKSSSNYTINLYDDEDY